jgi:phosphatidylinositol-3-phosphatase
MLRTVALGLVLSAGVAGVAPPPGRDAAPAGRVGHVFVIVLENKNFEDSFAAVAPRAPYLAQVLVSQGAFLRQYYGIGHVSLDNYIAMLSGQGPNMVTQSDCQIFQDFVTQGPATLDGQAIGQGCVYPASVPDLTGQLGAKGLSWKGYMEDMGNDPSRYPAGSTPATCGHPAVNAQDHTQQAAATDQYANRHNPFMYFHNIIDDAASCDAHVVNLDRLPADLASPATTPNFVFITPDLCSDGHDAVCADPGQRGGLEGINDFLSTWVPRILASPAYRQDGVLIVTFDESDVEESNGPEDAAACCAGFPAPNTPMPGIFGPGGGLIGAVVVSKFVKPGTTSDVPYNHYSLLRTLEDLFGLPYLGYAGNPLSTSFGADVFSEKMPVFPSKD